MTTVYFPATREELLRIVARQTADREPPRFPATREEFRRIILGLTDDEDFGTPPSVVEKVRGL